MAEPQEQHQELQEEGTEAEATSAQTSHSPKLNCAQQITHLAIPVTRKHPGLSEFLHERPKPGGREAGGRSCVKTQDKVQSEPRLWGTDPGESPSTPGEKEVQSFVRL